MRTGIGTRLALLTPRSWLCLGACVPSMHPTEAGGLLQLQAQQGGQRHHWADAGGPGGPVVRPLKHVCSRLSCACLALLTCSLLCGVHAEGKSQVHTCSKLTAVP
eukprot:1158202-Pelagomonas_calceolata.AAC.5